VFVLVYYTEMSGKGRNHISQLSIYIYIYIHTYMGWVWVGECFFWYQPTEVVPDQWLLNGCVCVCTPCTIKKEPHIFVRRKQTSAYKLVQLSSFTGFCWCCWLVVLKYVACLIFFANNDVKNCVIIYCLPRKGDGRSAHAWDTRLHPAITLAFK